MLLLLQRHQNKKRKLRKQLRGEVANAFALYFVHLMAHFPCDALNYDKIKRDCDFNSVNPNRKFARRCMAYGAYAFVQSSNWYSVPTSSAAAEYL